MRGTPFLVTYKKRNAPTCHVHRAPTRRSSPREWTRRNVCSDSGFSVINCTVWWYLWGCSCQDQNGGALQSVSLSLSFQPLVVPGPGRRVPTVGSSSLYMSPSACSTPPNPPRRPTVSLAEIEIASVLCVVCCRWHGACGRTDRPLCWPVIGHPRARGSMPSAFTNSQVPCSLSLSLLCFAEFICTMQSCIYSQLNSNANAMSNLSFHHPINYELSLHCLFICS